jgi:hypothetical protein
LSERFEPGTVYFATGAVDLGLDPAGRVPPRLEVRHLLSVSERLR